MKELVNYAVFWLVYVTEWSPGAYRIWEKAQ
jgi:hypothetical protein